MMHSVSKAVRSGWLRWLRRLRRSGAAGPDKIKMGNKSKSKSKSRKDKQQKKENENIHRDKCGGSAEPITACKVLGVVPSVSLGNGCCLESPKLPNWCVVCPPGDLPLNGEPGIAPPSKPSRKQAAFPIPVDEAGRENGKKLPSPKKVECEDHVLTFHSAISATKKRKCLLAPETQASLDNSITEEVPVVLEPEEKPPDIFEVPEYREDIYLYLRSIEARYMPKEGSGKKHPPISKSGRALLVDWLVRVADVLGLHKETLHLAVNYMDRFLWSSRFRGKLHLVGAAAMLIASKFEEVYPLHVLELLEVTQYGCTRKELLRMEQLMMKVLGFYLAAPTIHHFLSQYFLHQQQANSEVESLAVFLGALSLIDADLYWNYLPSEIAGAAFLLALYTITGKSWPESFKQKTGYSLESLEPCLTDLHQTFFRASRHALKFI